MPRTTQPTPQPATPGPVTGPDPTGDTAKRRRRAAGDAETAPAAGGTGTRRTKPAVDESGRGGPSEGEGDLDVNVVVLGGSLSTDPELRTYDSGAVAMRFLVTVRLTEPRRRVDVIPVTLWDPGRRLLRNPPQRGERVWLAGTVQRRFWDGPDGKRSRLEVVAHRLGRDGEGAPPTLAPAG